uniref:Rab-GAP TBC domain-containing protein n=1 Tax=Meloidogyne floridensis TaxID=298350 RepID=A0A915NWP7_9BILA
MEASTSNILQYQTIPNESETGELFEFEALLEIRERDGQRGIASRPNNFRSTSNTTRRLSPSAITINNNNDGSYIDIEQQGFFMRRDRDKLVLVMLKQTAGPRHLRVKNCFGMLLAPGRNLRQSDMHLLEMKSAGQGQHNPRVYVIEARWNPGAWNFEVLNTETPRDTRVFMSVAVDVTFEGLDESLRFIIECKARIFQQYERKVVIFESTTERERQLSSSAFDGDMERSPTRHMPTQLIHPANGSDSDSDEPLLSGSGDVCRECSEDRLAAWNEMIDLWKQTPEQRPYGLNSLIHDGIPDVLRGEVWLLLARIGPVQADLVQAYQMLLEKECPSEAIILRDIHRTFPAHEYFTEENDKGGQKALYRISKAYSLYDDEVGYCQGLSFLAAALLLHMPEEQAFCVLVRIMFDYGMRELFKTGFDALHLRFYQLQCLIKGMNTIFHISLALLKDSNKELLHSDFEGILKFFRVNLPRKYRTEVAARELIHAAVKLKISHKRLSKYEKEWHELKRQEIESQDPLERAQVSFFIINCSNLSRFLQRESQGLKEQILRLERENDYLARELVTSKICLQERLDTTEDQLETTLNQMIIKNRDCEELADRERKLREESEFIKQKCRDEVARLEEEYRRSEGVIVEYKKICTELGLASDEDKRQFRKLKRFIASKVSGCDRCSNELADCLDLSSNSQRPSSSLSTYDGEGSSVGSTTATNDTSAMHMMELVEKLQQYEQHIRQVELELAQTKLALVESQCQNQDLAHQMSVSTLLQNGSYSVNDNRPAWLRKTISSLREVAQAHGVTGSGFSSGSEENNVNFHSKFRQHQRSSSNASTTSTNHITNKYTGSQTDRR